MRADKVKNQEDICDIILNIFNKLDDKGFKFSLKEEDDLYYILESEFEELFPGLDYRSYN